MAWCRIIKNIVDEVVNETASFFLYTFKVELLI